MVNVHLSKIYVGGDSMVTCYTGKPGSGKTLDCMIDIDCALRRGKYVMCNFAINVPYFYKYVSSNDICPDVIIKWFNGLKRTGKEGEFLLVIDECQTIFNSRSWVSNSKKGWIEFFTQHRKLGFDVILICQNADMIDKQIRACIEYEVMHRRYSRFGLIGWVFSLLFGDYIRLKKWFGLKDILSRESFRGNKKIYGMYDTNELIKEF